MSSKSFQNATKLNGITSIIQFGAVADGTTDNTVAINNAIASDSLIRGENGWASVFFPAGIYKVDSTIQVPSKTAFHFDPACTIQLDGTSSSRFLNHLLAQGDVYEYNGNGDIWFTGGTIDCNNGSAALTFAHGYNLKFQNVTFQNAKDTHFVEINSSKNVLFDACYFKNITVTGTALYEMLQIDYSYSGGFPSFGGYDNTPCQNVVVQNCVFDRGHSGVGSHANPAAGLHTAITITNNTISNMSACGIRVQGWGYGSEVSNNYLLECGPKPFQCVGNADGVEILYNTVNGGGSSGGFWFSISDFVYTKKCTIVGNKSYDVDGEGFYFGGITDCRISGNEVYRSSKRGFFFANGASDNLVTNNTVFGCGNLTADAYDAFYIENSNCIKNKIINNVAKTVTGNIYRYAIVVQGITCSDNRINGNFFDIGSGATIIFNSGTLTEINGETFLSATVSVNTGDIALLDDITKYGGLKVASGDVSAGELYTDYARGWTNSGFRVGTGANTDSVNVKTFSGTAKMSIPTTTKLTIIGTATNPIRYVIGVDKL